MASFITGIGSFTTDNHTRSVNVRDALFLSMTVHCTPLLRPTEQHLVPLVTFARLKT